tara:strand:+ start:222350 stop:223630 length:1281 start_codon:yes stop_codon:yes gene_type:complete
MPLLSDSPIQSLDPDASAAAASADFAADASAAPAPRLTDWQKAELCSPDVLSNILKHLSEVEIAKIGQTSNIARQVLAQDALWTDKLNDLRQVNQTIPAPDNIAPGNVKATFDLHFQAMRARQLQEIAFFKKTATDHPITLTKSISTALDVIKSITKIDNLDTLIHLEKLLIQMNIELINDSLKASTHIWRTLRYMRGGDQDINRKLNIKHITRFPDMACALFTESHAKTNSLNFMHTPLLSSLPEEIFCRCPNLSSLYYETTLINRDTLPERIRTLPRHNTSFAAMNGQNEDSRIIVLEHRLKTSDSDFQPPSFYWSSLGAADTLNSAVLAARGGAAPDASAAGAILKPLTHPYKRTSDEISDSSSGNSTDCSDDETQEQTARFPVSNPALKAEASSDDEEERQDETKGEEKDTSSPRPCKRKRR